MRRTKPSAKWHHLPQNPIDAKHTAITVIRVETTGDLATKGGLGLTTDVETPPAVWGVFEKEVAANLKESGVLAETSVSTSVVTPQELAEQERQCHTCGHNGKAASMVCPKCTYNTFRPSRAVRSGGGPLELLFRVSEYDDPSGLEKVSLAARKSVKFHFALRLAGEQPLLAEGSVKKEWTGTFGLLSAAGTMEVLVKEAAEDVAKLIVKAEQSHWQGKVSESSGRFMATEVITARAMALVGFVLLVAMFILTFFSGQKVFLPGIAGLLLMAVATIQAAREKGRSVLLGVILACLVPVGWIIVARLGTRQEADAEARTLLRRRVASFLRYCLVIWFMIGSVTIWVLLILSTLMKIDGLIPTAQLEVLTLACYSLAIIVFAVALWKAKRWGLYGLITCIVLAGLDNIFGITSDGQSVSQALPNMVGSLLVLVWVWPSWRHLN